MKKLGDKAPAMLSIAVDVQGPEWPSRYVKEFAVTYPVVVDRANIFAGAVLGRRVIPLWSLLDENGVLMASRAAGPGRKTFQTLETLLARPPVPVGKGGPAGGGTRRDFEESVRAHPKNLGAWVGLIQAVLRSDGLAAADATANEALEALPEEKTLYMIRADLALRRGDKGRALAALKAGLELDPEDWLIHKQIWCVEHPERFYEGGVDDGWQRKTIQDERSRKRKDCIKNPKKSRDS